MNFYSIKIDQLIRCRRKSIGLIVTRAAKLVVRAPHWVSIHEINRLVAQKSSWIIKKQESAQKRQELPQITLTKAQKMAYKAQALDRLTQRVQYYAGLANLTYKTIRVGNARTRWGSCSSKGGLVFNWRLILMPERILDYLVVHELMHLKQQNHSKRFWQEVEAVIPDYKQDERWLKENGSTFIYTYLT